MILRVISDKYEQDNKTGPKATGTEPGGLRYIFTEFIELALKDILSLENGRYSH